MIDTSEKTTVGLLGSNSSLVAQVSINGLRKVPQHKMEEPGI